jgi:pimeloyl-ACP methyl ester carboxylesterase
MSLELAELATRDTEGGRMFKHDPLHLTLGPVPFVVEIAQQFWRRINCPVLLVEGAASRMRHGQEEADRREGCLPHARHVELPGAGHMMQRHAPALLAAELNAFVADESAPRRSDSPAE